MQAHLALKYAMMLFVIEGVDIGIWPHRVILKWQITWHSKADPAFPFGSNKSTLHLAPVSTLCSLYTCVSSCHYAELGSLYWVTESPWYLSPTVARMKTQKPFLKLMVRLQHVSWGLRANTLSGVLLHFWFCLNRDMKAWTSALCTGPALLMPCSGQGRKEMWDLL